MLSPDLSNRYCIVTVGFGVECEASWHSLTEDKQGPLEGGDPLCHFPLSSHYLASNSLLLHLFHFSPLFVYVNFSAQRLDCSYFKQMFQNFSLIQYMLSYQLQLQLSILLLGTG
jgi:hypothetical protein